uniref:Uncharacterized protein n=1 Tax=Lotus japonicus TaxID=34305 RepID=I3SG09_LOTJA|nr:unknown [Lotus japonicus]
MLNGVSIFFEVCSQPESKWKQRIIMFVTNIHWELINSLEPCSCQLASKFIVTKKKVSNTLTFSSRKPCSYKCINFG